MNSAPIFAVMFAGLITSIGPCIAPRYIAILGLCTGRPLGTRARIIGAFVLGTVLGYLTLANVAAVLARTVAFSQIIYVAMSATLIVCAIVTLLRADRHTCASLQNTSESLGGAFLLGLTSCFVISPCCSPVIAGFGVYGAGQPLNPSILVVAFCAGHFAPLVAGMMSFRFLPRLSEMFAGATSTVSAGLLASMGAYYALLA
jgi:thiol:disulfide interchange protein DsbD